MDEWLSPFDKERGGHDGSRGPAKIRLVSWALPQCDEPWDAALEVDESPSPAVDAVAVVIWTSGRSPSVPPRRSQCETLPGWVRPSTPARLAFVK